MFSESSASYHFKNVSVVKLETLTHQNKLGFFGALLTGGFNLFSVVHWQKSVRVYIFSTIYGIV